jgi:hypothetical protein
LAALLVVSLLGWSAPLSAQRAAPGERRLEGTVRDTVGTPLRDVTVLLMPVRRLTRTDDEGRFRFDSLPTGRLRVSARAIGYIAAGVDLIVARDTIIRVDLPMLRLAASLPAMMSTAARAGLSGVVGDTTYRALDSVRVRALGKSMETVTDSVGAFYLPLRPGPYMVRLDRDGFASQTVGVHIPDDSGKRVAVWLTPAGPLDAIEVMRQMNLFDLEQRLVRTRPVRYRTFSRETLQQYGTPDLLNALARATAQRVDVEVCGAINGGPVVAPLWSISLDEIEFVEANLYGATGIGSGTASRGPTSLNGMRARVASPSGTELSGRAGECPYVVWTRR